MSATDELRRMLDERGVEWRSKDEELGLNIDGFHDTRWQVNGVLWCFIESGDNTCLAMCGEWKGCTPEQAIAATLGSDASAVRLAERLRSIADEMRSVGASSMTPHELLACYANDVDKVADSLMFAATLGGGECKFVSSKGSDYPPVCSACGYELGIYDCEWFEDGTYGYDGNYCQNCGCKVVSE